MTSQAERDVDAFFETFEAPALKASAEAVSRVNGKHVPAPVTGSELAPLVGLEKLFAPVESAKFLVPGLGINPGAPTGFFGQGFTGKTLIAMSLGLSIATGRPAWGLYSVRRGRVLHLDYEQGLRLTARRWQRLAAGAGVTRDELEGRLDACVLPRLNLMTENADGEYMRLCEGWDLVILDALKGATPGIDENSSEIRDYMRVLTHVSERTGCTFLFLHQAGKVSPFGKSRKEAGRGSSAIYDDCQSVFVATADKGEATYVSHEKDRELGNIVPDFGLRIEDVEVDGDRKGGIRVVHLEAQEVKPSKETLEAEVVARAKKKIVELLEKRGEVKASSNELAAMLRMSRRDFAPAWADLKTGSPPRIINAGKFREPIWKLAPLVAAQPTLPQPTGKTT